MEKIVIFSTRDEITEVLLMLLEETSNRKQHDQPSFEKDRLSKTQAAKLVGISIPTLSKMIAKGKFKEYSLGRRKYFLKSEIIESLRNNS